MGRTPRCKCLVTPNGLKWRGYDRLSRRCTFIYIYLKATFTLLYGQTEVKLKYDPLDSPDFTPLNFSCRGDILRRDRLRPTKAAKNLKLEFRWIWFILTFKYPSMSGARPYRFACVGWPYSKFWSKNNILNVTSCILKFINIVTRRWYTPLMTGSNSDDWIY
jgi:hypothetical protein